jgi:hypothetical protein
MEARVATLYANVFTHTSDVRREAFMRAVFSAVLLGAMLPALSLAQECADPEAPKTRLEAFAAQEGVVVIRAFSRIGTVRGQDGSSVVVDSNELTNAGTGQREYGLAVTVTADGRQDRGHGAYVDFDEIPALLAALEYLGNMDGSSTTLDRFQAGYRTRGGLVVGAFNNDSGTMATVSSGIIGKTTAYLPFADLGHIREFVQSAYASLDKLRAGTK